ncbi:MAG: YbfB/YjiJ family MFS transporter, partial [Rhodospirillales bacterium]|nr:YbfB/YjiJ family MFS transporter [Rhodospirillales bacterium]
MRAVTFDCTVCSAAAARLMVPHSATAAKTRRSAASMRVSPNAMAQFINIRFSRCQGGSNLASDSRGPPFMAMTATSTVPIAVSPARQTIAGMLALAVGIGIGRFVFTPILPPMMAELALSRAASGAIASANFAGYLAGALFAASGRL